jgi:hypothetical protein
VAATVPCGTAASGFGQAMIMLIATPKSSLAMLQIQAVPQVIISSIFSISPGLTRGYDSITCATNKIFKVIPNLSSTLNSLINGHSGKRKD